MTKRFSKAVNSQRKSKFRHQERKSGVLHRGVSSLQEQRFWGNEEST